MNNSKIIANALQARGMTDDQLQQLLTAYHGDLPFHTVPEWSRRGYHVKPDAEPLFSCYLWKHTNKPSRAAVEAAEEAGEDIPENSPHFYQKLSYIYSFSQVEKNAPAADLETIKAQLQNLPGVVLTVKGEKTGAPVVWLTGDTEAHADAIKAAGGIWSRKKSAYWVKPSAAAPADKPAAPAPQAEPEKPAAPAPCTALVPVYKFDLLPAPAPQPGREEARKKPARVYETWTIHPGKRTPQPWKKCEFATVRRNEKTQQPEACKMTGYTDGIYNYYSAGSLWFAIHPVYGLAVSTAHSRKAAQADAMKNADKVKRVEAQAAQDDRMQKYAALVKSANDGDNVTLF